jgi:transcriptional regulator with XRE-family HTH domain
MDLLRIAQLVRTTRTQQGLTLEALAARTGLSKGFISRLENFRVTPSLKALGRVSQALGINMAAFFESETRPVPFLLGEIAHGEEVARNSEPYGMRYFSLAFRKPDRVMDPFVIEYRRGAEQRGFTTHDAEEFFILLDGQILFQFYDEQTSYALRAGHTVYLADKIPHRVVLETGCDFARAMVVYCNAARAREGGE